MENEVTRRGRPLTEIDEEEFKKLCELLCTLREIAAWFECSEDTIQRWCMRHFEENFAAVFDKYSARGKIALRRAMMRDALKGNATMQIWLSKQYLNFEDEKSQAQKDKEKEPEEIVIRLAYPDE